MVNKTDAQIGNAKIKVIGVGGGGGNAVARMKENAIQGVELYVANTDVQALEQTGIKNQIILGQKTTGGKGAGANPEVAKKAAMESEDTIRAALKDSDMVFIAAGLGGGTGSGAAPVIAQISKDMGILTVGVVTKPFTFEGGMRKSNCKKAFDELKEYVDAVIVIPNDKLLSVLGNAPIKEAFKCADDILRQGVQSITDLITIPSEINLDFADVRSTLTERGLALFGVGSSKGSSRAIEAAENAIASPLLDASIQGANSAIVNITADSTFTVNDAFDVINVITEASGQDMDLIWGYSTNENLKDECIVTIIATGLTENTSAIENRSTLFGTNSSKNEQVITQVPPQRQQPQPSYKSPYEDDDDTFMDTSAMYNQNRRIERPQVATPRNEKTAEEEKKSFLGRNNFW